MATAVALGGDVTNLGAETYAASMPYRARIEITGCADILLHRWSCDAVEAKSKAAKGSKAKKSDDLESYVYRNEDGEICIPGEYLRQSIMAAAKFRQDPRSPRKSARDLVSAALIPLTNLASLGKLVWDYEDRRRVRVQQNAITRVRPAIRTGWKVEVDFMVTLPEYVSPEMLQGMVVDAGRLIGVGDFRPTFGRFNMTGFEMIDS
jgi:hypothetical protein